MNDNKYVTWVLTSNTNTCRIYTYSKKANELAVVKEIQHPENKLRDMELTSDKPGHYKTSGTARGAFEQRSDPKEIHIADFAREIVEELDRGRNAHAFGRLIVVAEPHMNGLIGQHMNKNLSDLVTQNIKKDVLQLSGPELSDFLQQHV